MAEEDEKEGAVADKGAASAAPATSAKNPLVAILLIFNLIAMGAVAYFQYQFMQAEAKRPDLTQLLKEGQLGGIQPEVAEEQAPTEDLNKDQLFELESFTVNLAQGDGPRRYVRMNAVLKLSSETELTEVEARKPQIRDTVINILNTKRPEDLLKREGKFNLKEEIKSSINSFLIDGKVLDIFYVGFQIN